MSLDIHERDIDSSLCQTCAACCRITFKLRDTTTRYRRFLRQIGYELLPPPVAGKPDCCPGKHDAKLDMGFCRHLDIIQGETRPLYVCQLHGSDKLPELCREFNCVSWAKASDHYSEKNPLLRVAQTALDQLRERLKK